MECTHHPTRGSGFRITFDWTDVTVPGEETKYRVLAEHRGARFPIVNQLVSNSELTHTSCGFVIDSNLKDWQWRGRVENPDHGGEWTGYRSFEFAPCRLAEALVTHRR